MCCGLPCIPIIASMQKNSSNWYDDGYWVLRFEHYLWKSMEQMNMINFCYWCTSNVSATIVDNGILIAECSMQKHVKIGLVRNLGHCVFQPICLWAVIKQPHRNELSSTAKLKCSAVGPSWGQSMNVACTLTFWESYPQKIVAAVYSFDCST